MQVVTPQFIQGKIVLLRLDIDVPLRLSGYRRIAQGHDPSTQSLTQASTQASTQSSTSFEVVDDFRLKAGLPTLKMCLENAQKVIIMGHIGRPEGKVVPELSVAPIMGWLQDNIDHHFLDEEKLFLLENLRFECGEEKADLDYAKCLISLVDPEGTGNCVYVNEAFASYHEAASTTVLPTLLPALAGLRFAQEVEKLTQVRENPQKPLVAIIGGAKVEDKLPVVLALSKIADAVLVGGKIAAELKDARGPVASVSQVRPRSFHSLAGDARDLSSAPPLAGPSTDLPFNVFVGKLNEGGTDIAPETTDSWKDLIEKARMIVWNGPVGRIERDTWKESEPCPLTPEPSDGRRATFQVDDLGSAKGTYELAQMIASSGAESIVGGGDTVGFLDQLGMLDRFGFVSTGGGAMLEFLETGTLPTIEALK